MSNIVYVDTYVNTYGDTLRALRDFHREQEVEKQLLLNTIALAEAELTKPEYFGFLIERDRMGYLEALSQTKTTFRGINPHDPLNGIVVNGEINPDFVMMLEKNFFKENSENLDKDELYFVRYQAERNKIIKQLERNFENFSIDNEFLIKEIGVSQEELFQHLYCNEWVWTIDANSGKTNILDVKQYSERLKKQELLETLPYRFCDKKEMKGCKIDLDSVFEKKREMERKRIELEKKQRELEEERKYNASLPLRWLLTLACLSGIIYIFLFL